MQHSKIYIRPKGLKVIIQLLLMIAWSGAIGLTPTAPESESLFILYLPLFVLLILAGFTWLLSITTDIFNYDKSRDKT